MHSDYAQKRVMIDSETMLEEQAKTMQKLQLQQSKNLGQKAAWRLVSPTAIYLNYYMQTQYSCQYFEAMQILH